jgi:hypothetical protein
LLRFSWAKEPHELLLRRRTIGFECHKHGESTIYCRCILSSLFAGAGLPECLSVISNTPKRRPTRAGTAERLCGGQSTAWKNILVTIITICQKRIDVVGIRRMTCLAKMLVCVCLCLCTCRCLIERGRACAISSTRQTFKVSYTRTGAGAIYIQWGWGDIHTLGLGRYTYTGFGAIYTPPPRRARRERARRNQFCGVPLWRE